MGNMNFQKILTHELTSYPRHVPVVIKDNGDMRVTLVPRATLRGVAELHVASGMPQWRMFVTCCYF